MIHWGSFCTFCGFELSGDFPKKCANGHMTWLSPVAVGVALQPVIRNRKTGLLGVQRNIPPHKGGFSLLGGFTDNTDTPPETVVRELFEETGLTKKPEDASYFWSFAGSSHNDADPRRHTVNFFSLPPLKDEDVDWSRSDHEVSKLILIELDENKQSLTIGGEKTELCFSSHHEAALRFLTGLTRQL